ncbi:IS66 family transposase, partial [Myxococcota bacterium]|nr:IS66 family transposase [Myxococcota bacterium]
RLEHVREHLVNMEYVLETLASKDGDYIIKAEAPPTVIEGGKYGPGVYAHAVVAKCVDSLPLHRIEKMLARDGASIARSTLVSLFHRSANLLEPIYNRLFEIARNDRYVHADETTLRVQAEEQCLRGWIWVMLSKMAIVYLFDESRSGEVAKRMLGDTEGSLQIDGYSSYNLVTKSDEDGDAESDETKNDEGRMRVGCWSHGRRKFFEAMRSVPEAREVLDLIVELYRIEHLAAEKGILGSEAHRLLRDTQSRDVINEIDEWVKERHGKYPPKSKMGIALTYATKQRKSLSRFLEDPKLPLDNNIAERALRIIALGRKNFLFAGHVEGAQNLAILQSIVATCALHDIDPYEYIKDILIRLQTHPASRIDEILPWNWQPQ